MMMRWMKSYRIYNKEYKIEIENYNTKDIKELLKESNTDILKNNDKIVYEGDIL